MRKKWEDMRCGKCEGLIMRDYLVVVVRGLALFRVSWQIIGGFAERRHVPMCVAIVLRIDFGARGKAERLVRRLAIVQVMGAGA